MQTNDLNRMILAIEEDARLRIKEIKIQSVAKYNMIKTQAIELGIRNLEEDYNSKIKEINKKFEIEKHRLLNKQKMNILEEKNRKLREIFDKIQIRLKDEPLDPEIIKQSMIWIEEKKLSEYFAFCKTSDQKTINQILNINFKILPQEALGGIIICSKTGDFFSDNSFATRLEIIKKQNLGWINSKIFK